MKTFTQNLLFLSLTSLQLFSTPLSADTAEEVVTDEHVAVGSRPMDPEMREMTKYRRILEKEEEVARNQERAQAVLQRVANHASSQPFKFAPRALPTPPLFSPPVVDQPPLAPPTPSANRTFSTCHWVNAIADNNNKIELEDSSEWEINYDDKYILNTWQRNDSIVITPVYSWFSSYEYYIENKTNNSYVMANLDVGPKMYGDFSHWIIEVREGVVCLEDYSIWHIDSRDWYVLKEWANNDHIIVGLYDSWFYPADHILINANMNSYVRARQL